MTATPETASLRERMSTALYASMDCCARCKVCDVQTGAAMGVASEAAEAERHRIIQFIRGKADMWRRTHPSDAGVASWLADLLDPDYPARPSRLEHRDQ